MKQNMPLKGTSETVPIANFCCMHLCILSKTNYDGL